jgi:hypothetical protein
VVSFAQTHPFDERQSIAVAKSKGRIMATPKNDKHRQYSHYAAHCLQRASAAKDPETRAIEREMIAEWLKLADAALHPLKRAK